MAILLKTVSVQVSSIQIMQVRVQNKGKSVWKIRYDGDVSDTFSPLLIRLLFLFFTLCVGLILFLELLIYEIG